MAQENTVFEDTEAHSEGVTCIAFSSDGGTHGYMLMGQNYSRVGC